MALVYDRYLDYATARLRDGASGAAAVEEALAHTHARWAALLAGPSPVGDAWCVLRAAVTAHRPRPDATAPRQGPVDVLHRHLPDPLADAALLHHGLGLSASDAARLMGTDPGAVRAGLRSADRLIAAGAPSHMEGRPPRT
ncbi:hypothetical protein ACIPLC_15635 [Kitasatospora sp. NPDC086801]|uniref:hypothetical protein n=1 Tax=unclassified Kitasatospora TaxID=2633591 RepID=UPI0038293D8D